MWIQRYWYIANIFKGCDKCKLNSVDATTVNTQSLLKDYFEE